MNGLWDYDSSGFLVRTNGGLFCRYGDFYLDPVDPVKHAVISHGHGDHATPGHEFAYCTPPTYLFMESRFAKIYLPQTQQISFHQPFQLGEVTLTFLPAGHILGSAQVLMEHRGIRYLYTGDYKLQPDPTCEAFEGTKAHVLITESTFANRKLPILSRKKKFSNYLPFAVILCWERIRLEKHSV